MNIHILLATTSLLAVSSLVHATPLGLSTDPAGAAWDRGDSSTAYAVLDGFPSFNFSNLNSGFTTAGFTTLAFSQSTTLGSAGQQQGAGIYDNVGTQTVGTDVFYGGGRGGSFSIDGTASFTFYGIVLQVKRTSSNDSLAGVVNPTLNGLAPGRITSSFGSGDSTDTNGLYSVTTYYWGITGGTTTLDLDFATPTHRGIDGITLDVGPTPVPEPGTYALAAVLLGFVGFRAFNSRRKRTIANA